MINQPLIFKLTLVRQMYLKGKEEATAKGYIHGMLASINLFLAVETILQLVISENDENPTKVIGIRGYVGGKPSDTQVKDFGLTKVDKFEQLYNQVVAVLRFQGKLEADESLFTWGKINRLRIARNSAQHEGVAPNVADLSIFISTTQNFVNRILTLCFSSHANSIEQISLASLIEDEVLQKYVVYAENAYYDGYFRKSTLISKIAFLLGRLKRRYDWWSPSTGKIFDDFTFVNKISKKLNSRTQKNTDPIIFDLAHPILKVPYLEDNWILGIQSYDRELINRISPFLREIKANEQIGDSDETYVLKFFDADCIPAGEYERPDLATTPSVADCLWLLNFITETLIRWDNEEAGRYTALPLSFLQNLPGYYS